MNGFSSSTCVLRDLGQGYLRTVPANHFGVVVDDAWSWCGFVAVVVLLSLLSLGRVIRGFLSCFWFRGFFSTIWRFSCCHPSNVVLNVAASCDCVFFRFRQFSEVSHLLVGFPIFFLLSVTQSYLGSAPQHYSSVCLPCGMLS